MADFWKIVLPLLAALATWFLNERQKRKWEQYQRKETSYKELLSCVRGFYEGGTLDLKQKFLDQLAQAWLYCPDEVVRLGYNFLKSMDKATVTSPDERQERLGAFVLAIRKDLLSGELVKSTDLKKSDFLIITPR